MGIQHREARLRGLVSNEALRQSFEASSVTAYEVAIRMGWFESGAPDSYRVRQALGLAHYSPGHGYPPKRRTHVTPSVAARLADAMGLLPVEIGL